MPPSSLIKRAFSREGKVPHKPTHVCVCFAPFSRCGEQQRRGLVLRTGCRRGDGGAADRCCHPVPAEPERLRRRCHRLVRPHWRIPVLQLQDLSSRWASAAPAGFHPKWPTSPLKTMFKKGSVCCFPGKTEPDWTCCHTWFPALKRKAFILLFWKEPSEMIGDWRGLFSTISHRRAIKTAVRGALVLSISIHFTLHFHLFVLLWVFLYSYLCVPRSFLSLCSTPWCVLIMCLHEYWAVTKKDMIITFIRKGG